MILICLMKVLLPLSPVPETQHRTSELEAEQRQNMIKSNKDEPGQNNNSSIHGMLNIYQVYEVCVRRLALN